jgi:hypothetical protein
VRSLYVQMLVPLPLLFVFQRRLMRDDQFLTEYYLKDSGFYEMPTQEEIKEMRQVGEALLKESQREHAVY